MHCGNYTTCFDTNAVIMIQLYVMCVCLLQGQPRVLMSISGAVTVASAFPMAGFATAMMTVPTELMNSTVRMLYYILHCR